MMNLYLRKVMMDNGRFSVMAFKSATDPIEKRVAYWPYHYSTRPDKRFKSVMFNCHRWAIVWLPDIT